MKNNLLSVPVLIGVLLIATAPTAFAQEAAIVKAAFVLNVSAGMKDILTEYTGKRVALRLASGEEVEGTITAVGNSLVHMSRLAGKEFYDSVVSIDSISSIRIRVR